MPDGPVVHEGVSPSARVPTPIVDGAIRFVRGPSTARPDDAGLRRDDAGAGDRTISVVVDTAWTPTDLDGPSLVPLRPVFAQVIEATDVFEEALGLVDGWAATVGLDDRLLVEGVTYWPRVREPMWHWMHERLLWSHAVQALIGDRDPGPVEVPAEETALIDVLRARGLEVLTDPDGADVDADGAGTAVVAPGPARRSVVGRVRSRMRRLVRRVRGDPVTPSGGTATARHDAVLAARLRAMVDGPRPRVLVLTFPTSFQRIGAATDELRDPNLHAVIETLGRRGLASILVGTGMNRRKDADPGAVERDDRLLPAYFLRTALGRPGHADRTARAVDALTAALDAAASAPLLHHAADLGPAFVTALRATVLRIVEGDVPQRARAEALFDLLEPDAIVMTHEGQRTAWLAAAADRGVPSFALQHGVLYPTHPGYPRRRRASLRIPTRTFVFGEYERRVLLGGAFHPEEVIASGSPRVDLDTGLGHAPGTGADRDVVRGDLGVAPGDRVIVVSTLHVPFVRRSHLTHFIESVLGGPLPGIHVVFKLHPGEPDEGPYRDLMAGLARGGGYAAPPVSVVKHIDLYRLLRAADAHVGLHSTVLTDAVVAGTANLIAIVEPHRDLVGYVAAGVATPVRSVDDVRRALADPQPPDPSARAAFLADHFRPGDASARIVEEIERHLRARMDVAGRI